MKDGEDKGKSKAIMDSNVKAENLMSSPLYKAMLHSANIYRYNEVNLYQNDYRFGLYNEGGSISKLKEFLFFTKPDLNILKRSKGWYSKDGLVTGNVKLDELTDELTSYPFFIDLKHKHMDTIHMLQGSAGRRDPFNHLLQNSVISNLEIPALEGTTIDSPVNNYGVGFQYRGSSEASDDGLDFSLEFKDTRWLDVYNFFRAYEEYQILKHHGVIGPHRFYISNRILSDQFAIYKFMVDEDMETIVYYCKLYGVMPMGLPRDVFSNTEFQNGLSYTINFKAAFFEDMNYQILRDFNTLHKMVDPGLREYSVPIYNDEFGSADMRPCRCAYVKAEKGSSRPSVGSNNRVVYKLKWEGSDAL